MAGVQIFRLNNLSPNVKNALIVGIIIAKSSPRVIGSKKKNGESRGVTSFTVRDSDVDTINVDAWGTEYFVLTFYERFLVGDVVEISSPKICVKTGENEMYKPQLDIFNPHLNLLIVQRRHLYIALDKSQKILFDSSQAAKMLSTVTMLPNIEIVSSPFYLSLNEGQSDVTIHSGDTFSRYLPLLHIPTKPPSGYYGLAEVMKLSESSNVYVDVLVVVKSIKPAKSIKTKTGRDMSVRSVEIIDNTTPASLNFDIFDIDTIQRVEDWRALESVLFIADARVSWRGRGATLVSCSRSVVTHQPHSADAEALRLYVRNQATTRGGEAAAWAAWSGERPSAASVAQVRDRLAAGAPFCASLHALLSHLDLEELVNTTDPNIEELRVRFVDHTGELNARLPVNIMEDTFGYSSEQLKMMSPDDRAAIKWKLLLEQCSAKLAASPPRLIVLSIRRASPVDPIPLY